MPPPLIGVLTLHKNHLEFGDHTLGIQVQYYGGSRNLYRIYIPDNADAVGQTRDSSLKTVA